VSPKVAFMNKKKIIYVGPADPNKKHSPIAYGPPRKKNTMQGICYFNGEAYTPGTLICSEGILLLCQSDGTWEEIGEC